ALVSLLVLAVVTPAWAGLDIDFGAAVRINDDTDLFVSISSRYFDRDRRSIEKWGTRYSSDDLAVALFIARYGHCSARDVFERRARRQSWWEISVAFGVPMDVWFVPVSRKPGPPYGKAYGHWKKHKKHQRVVVLSDDDLRHLVSVKMVHEYYGVPVEVAMEWRASGRDLENIVAGEYRNRHGGKHDADDRTTTDEAHNQNRGNGKGKTKNKGKS
ncbi:MAG: hypothetical protein R3344_07030, partial [Acidobacteriota bacterium]|nr:hypothetical protein [Acidobacteriota bacterium]